MSDELLARLAPINAALDATVERDLTEFRATETVDERGFRLSQDFLGDSTPAQLANDAASVFDNIAKIKNHMPLSLMGLAGRLPIAFSHSEVLQSFWVWPTKV